MALAALLAFFLSSQAQELPSPPGRLVDGIACASDPSQTYALYLPAGYTPERRWPLLLVFDPRSRGAMAAEIFRDAADRFGWIVASSNNTMSDGPWEPNERAVAAMVPDLLARLPIDEARLYAAGFSGGGGVAWALARDSGRLAGIISVGAPEPGTEHGRDPAVPWFGAAGRRDFNFIDARATYERLAPGGAPRRLEFFDGAHEWFPSSMATRAVGWHEALAMQAGRAPRNGELAAGILRGDIEEAARLEAAGRLTDAHRLYEAAAGALDGLTDVSAAREAAAALETSAARARLAKDEARAEAAERGRKAPLGRALAGLYGEDLPLLPALRGALRLETLRRQAARGGPEGEAAARSLEGVYVQVSFYLPRDFAARRQYDRAARAFEVAAEIHPERPGVWYELAAWQAMSGARASAVRSLERGVAAGLTGRARVEGDERFASLRGDEAFTAVLEKMGTDPISASSRRRPSGRVSSRPHGSAPPS